MSVTLALLVAATIGIDAFRIGFFADDFHFLDAARRFSGWELFSGAHGVWPWFRPISRELYFQFIESWGSHGLAVAHTISLLVLLGIVGLLWRIGTRWLEPATVAVAIGLFLTYDYTKFLASTASGFQDLFALFWILVALDAHMTGRRRLAIAAVFLAPLAKETGFVIMPLLAAYDVVLTRDRRLRPVWTRYSLAAALAFGLHVVARWSWPAGGSAFEHSRDPRQLASAIASAVQAFISPPSAPPHAGTVACAVLGVVALVVLSNLGVVAPPALEHPSARPHGRVTPFLAVATALGALPVVAGHLLKLALALGYHLFPAVPWGSFLLAHGIACLPRVLRRVGVPVLIGWNILGSGFVALDLDSPESWDLGPVNWRWAVRLSAEAQRLGGDLRRELPVRPESLVVLYDGVPAGAFFQTEDGPATRVLLGDPTVRAYGLNSPPPAVREERLAILAFDPHQLHLRAVEWLPSEILLRAMKAVIAGRGDVAEALLAFRASADPARFDRAYVRSAAVLLLGGPSRFVDELARDAGLGDTTASRSKEASASLSRDDPGLGAAMGAMLGAPRSAAAHSALADSLIARGIIPGAGVELRFAAALDGRRFADRYRLALVMLDLGGATEAIAELEGLATEPQAGALALQARSLAARVRKTLPPSQ